MLQGCTAELKMLVQCSRFSVLCHLRWCCVIVPIPARRLDPMHQWKVSKESLYRINGGSLLVWLIFTGMGHGGSRMKHDARKSELMCNFWEVVGAQQGLRNPSQTKTQVRIWSWASSMCSAGTQCHAQKEKCERVAVLLRVSAWTQSFESSVLLSGGSVQLHLYCR